MNVVVTILIAGMLGTGTVPDSPDEKVQQGVNLAPQSLLYSFESTDHADGRIDSAIWEQVMAGMAGSENSEFYEVYLISGENLRQAQKLCRIPMNDHSYSINVPPACKLLYVGKHVDDGVAHYTIKGVVNQKEDWVYISAVLKDSQVNLLTKDNSKMFTSLQPK